MKVAMLGAHGNVGTALREELADDPPYEFTYVDVEDHPDVDTVVADMRDYDAIRAAIDGHDAAVFLSLNPELNWQVTDVEWSPALMDNLWGTVNAYRAALDAGLDSFVFASTNHVVGGYERKTLLEGYDHDRRLRIDREDSVRPDSMYAVSKLFGEDLGRFAAGWHGLSVYCLRFGLVTPRGHDHPYYLAEAHSEAGDFSRDSDEYEDWAAFGRAIWLSHRDLAALLDACLRDDTVAFDVFNGVSDNEGRWLDIERAREVLGYDPVDDGSTWDGPPN